MNSTIHSASVLQVIPRLDTGGAELATVEITEAVVRAGGRVFVLSEGGRLRGEIETAGGQFVEFPAATKNPLQMLANGFALAKFVRERGVDIIHARSRAPAWSALMAARMTGTAFITTYHGAYGNSGPFKPLYNSVMARGDRVIANSRYTGDLVHERHGTPRERIRVIPRGVDLVRYNPAAVSRARIDTLRRHWGVEDKQRIVLHAARLTGWKGQHDVIEAAAKVLRDPDRKCVFILAGDPQGRESYVAELESRIASHDLGDRVRLVGHCDDMPAAYGAAHVTLIASTEPEAFGRTSAEAQAMGCPVIVTRQGASPETLVSERENSDKGTGWIVPPGAPSRLANAIAEALSLSDRERRAMAQRARSHVARAFSSEAMKRQTLAVYDECLRSALAGAFDAAGVRQKRHGES